jgi:hypothetical protein
VVSECASPATTRHFRCEAIGNASHAILAVSIGTISG